MPQASGNLANHVGRNRWNMAAACRLAKRTSADCAAGRIWNTAEKFSSVASVSAINRRYRSPFFRPSTETVASTCTRNSTNAALGGGRSWDSEAKADTDQLHGRNPDQGVNAVGKSAVAPNNAHRLATHCGDQA